MVYMEINTFIGNLEMFPLISRYIISIKELTQVPKIICKCDVKSIMKLQIETIMLVCFKVLDKSNYH